MVLRESGNARRIENGLVGERMATDSVWYARSSASYIPS